MDVFLGQTCMKQITSVRWWASENIVQGNSNANQ